MSAVQRQNAQAFLATFDARDYNTLANLLSDNFTHRFLPGSVKGLGTPVRNKQQFLGHVKEAESRFQSFNFQPPIEIIEGQDVVVLHLVTDGKTTTGKPLKNEHMMTFRFDGEKISSVKDFVDSKYTSEMAE